MTISDSSHIPLNNDSSLNQYLSKYEHLLLAQEQEI